MSKVFMFHGTGGHAGENWFPWLKMEIEKMGHEVIIPQFPTPENQTPESWFEVLDQYRDQIGGETIIIGHSVGGSFLLRVLESLDVPIRASFFVATPIGIQPIVSWSGDQPFTGHPYDWKKIVENAGKPYVYHSDNDPYVGIENGKELAKHLETELIFVQNAGHFNAKAGYLEFEDLLDRLKKELG